MCWWNYLIITYEIFSKCVYCTDYHLFAIIFKFVKCAQKIQQEEKTAYMNFVLWSVES